MFLHYIVHLFQHFMRHICVLTQCYRVPYTLLFCVPFPCVICRGYTRLNDNSRSPVSRTYRTRIECLLPYRIISLYSCSYMCPCCFMRIAVLSVLRVHTILITLLFTFSHVQLSRSILRFTRSRNIIIHIAQSLMLSS